MATKPTLPTVRTNPLKNDALNTADGADANRQTGRAEPSVTRIGLVAAILNCDLAWLITGQGDQTGRGEEGAEVTDDQNSERKLAANAAYGALLMPSRETPELEPIARRLGRALGLEDNSDLVSDGQRNRIRELRTSKNTCEG